MVSVVHGPSPILVQASCALQMEYTPQQGRYITVRSPGCSREHFWLLVS